MSMVWRNRSRHHSELTNWNVYVKFNPETLKIVKFIKGSCNICAGFKSRKINNQMTSRSDFRERGKSKHGYCSSLSTSTW